MDSAPFPTLSSGGLPLPAPSHSVEPLGHSPEAHRVLPMGALPVRRRGPRFPRFPRFLGRHLSCEGERRHDPHPLRGMVTPRCPPGWSPLRGCQGGPGPEAVAPARGPQYSPSESERRRREPALPPMASRSGSPGAQSQRTFGVGSDGTGRVCAL